MNLNPDSVLNENKKQLIGKLEFIFEEIDKSIIAQSRCLLEYLSTGDVAPFRSPFSANRIGHTRKL